ncbi:MAG: cell filamentation protein Fic [Gammaproteobacteria bacterium]|nr:MAG: cell filamentation protein Fic [Gammaproteobacteria bacterium]
MNFNNIKQSQEKALFIAKKHLPDLVYNVIRLEGINYTLPEVQTLLDGITVGGHKLIDEKITTNQIKAWQFLFNTLAKNKFVLDKIYIHQLHNILAKDEALKWGKFRDGKVSIAGTNYLPPDFDKLEEFYQNLMKTPQPVKIKQIYQYAINIFLQIARNQFFYDGNKRTGRLMMNGILIKNGLPFINLPATKQLEFNQLMIDFYPTGNSQPMTDFMLNCLNPVHIQIMSE